MRILPRLSRSECHEAARALQSCLVAELGPSAAGASPDVDPDAVRRLERFARELSDTSQD